MRRRIAESAGALRQVLCNVNLRRLALAWGATWSGEWALITAVAVYAFEVGGAAAVAAVGVIRMLPAALAAPFAAGLAERLPRERVLTLTSGIRAVAVALAAIALAADAAAVVVFALAGVAAVTFTAHRPAQAALLPSLCRSPQELTSANVATTVVESSSILLGPMAAALVLSVGEQWQVLAAAAGAMAVAAWLTSGIRYEQAPRVIDEPRAVEGVVAAALHGFRALATHADARAVIGLAVLQTLVRGILTVLLVVLAIEMLEMGDSGVGVLTAAIGVGGVAGAFLAMAVVGRRGLGMDLATGLVLWGLPITLVGLWPSEAAALLILPVIGIGNSLVDVSAFTLLARVVDDRQLARMFGCLETLIMATVAAGSVLAPLLVAMLGASGALIVTGLVLPAGAVLALPALRRIDGNVAAVDDCISLLRKVPLMRPLPVPTLEQLARSLEGECFEAGATVWAQGDAGERFYIIESGEAAVYGDGRMIRRLGPGQSFGEIALLRDVPRTATVTATTELRVQGLSRARFVPAVTGYSTSASAADETVGALLSSFKPRTGFL